MMRPMRNAGEIEGIHCPAISPHTIERAIKTRNARINEQGELERKCGKCGEHWHADTEFWYRGDNAFGLQGWCKACQEEHRRFKRAQAREQKAAEAAA